MNEFAELAIHAFDSASFFRSQSSTNEPNKLHYGQSSFMLNRFRLSWIFIVCFGVAAGVRADPIPVATLQLTAGHAAFDHQNDDRSMAWSGSGTGFDFSLFADDLSLVGRPGLDSPSRILSGNDPDFDHLAGFLRVGTTNTDFTQLSTNGWTFFFDHVLTTSVSPMPMNPEGVFVMTYTFGLDTLLRGVSPTAQEFRWMFAGKGTGQTSYQLESDQNLIRFATDLTFQTAEPVPEPGTFFLFAAGSTLVARRVRRGRRARVRW